MKRPFGKKDSTQTDHVEEKASRPYPYAAMNQEQERYAHIMQNIRDGKIQTKEELLDAFSSFLEFITVGKSIENQLVDTLTKKNKTDFTMNDQRLQDLIDILQETPDPDRWHTEEETDNDQKETEGTKEEDKKQSRRSRWKDTFNQKREQRNKDRQEKAQEAERKKKEQEKTWREEANRKNAEREKQKKDQERQQSKSTGGKQQSQSGGSNHSSSNNNNQQKESDWYYKDPNDYAAYLSLEKKDKDLFEMHNNLLKFINKHTPQRGKHSTEQKDKIRKEVLNTNKIMSKDDKDLWRQVVKIYHPDRHQKDPEIFQKLYEIIFKELQIFQP